jgi:hypothetical protein
MHANHHLSIYLNDHLAGSVIALEMLAEVTDLPTVAAVRAEIVADREVLEQLMADLGVEISQTRQAAAWMTEKLGKLKLHMDDPHQGALRRLELLETVAMGIGGKAALWATLAQLPGGALPLAQALDLPALIARAEDQFARLEPLRFQAAQEAFVA